MLVWPDAVDTQNEQRRNKEETEDDPNALRQAKKRISTRRRRSGSGLSTDVQLVECGEPDHRAHVNTLPALWRENLMRWYRPCWARESYQVAQERWECPSTTRASVIVDARHHGSETLTGPE